VSSGAVAKNNKLVATKEQSNCMLNAFTAYNQAGIALYQRQGVNLPTIEDAITKRRLLEGYCVQYVQCLNVPPIALGAMFSSCLDDEDEERLKERSK
jgi:hypothetical protein